MKTFSVSPANYIDWRSQAAAFETMSAFGGGYVNLTGGRAPRGGPDHVRHLGLLLRPEGDSLSLGRTFAPGEDEPGKNRVVILGEELWKSRFGGKADVVGQAIDLNGQKYTVVGVLPARSSFSDWEEALDSAGVDSRRARASGHPRLFGTGAR